MSDTPDQQPLFRPEALAHRNRSLYGEVKLYSGPSTWLVTVLIIVFFGLVLAGLYVLSGQL